MTQQEQQSTYVPGQRAGEYDDEDVAVGTAHAPHRRDEAVAFPADATDGADEAAERYPAGTYASGTADTDAAERDGVEVVDRDEALADEPAADETRSDLDRTAADFDGTAADSDGTVSDSDGRAADSDATAAGEARYEAAGDGAGPVTPAEDEREEVATARAEEAEDARWEAEHADDGDERPEAEAGELAGADAGERAEAGEVAAVETDDATATAVDEREEREERAADSLPGAVEAAPVGALWADGAVDGLRERWRALQLRFIDEPRAVAGEADQLVGEAIDSIAASLQQQRQRLGAWQGEGGDDTERLRAAVRGYRDFLDRLLGL